MSSETHLNKRCWFLWFIDEDDELEDMTSSSSSSDDLQDETADMEEVPFMVRLINIIIFAITLTKYIRSILFYPQVFIDKNTTVGINGWFLKKCLGIDFIRQTASHVICNEKGRYPEMPFVFGPLMSHSLSVLCLFLGQSLSILGPDNPLITNTKFGCYIWLDNDSKTSYLQHCLRIIISYQKY